MTPDRAPPVEAPDPLITKTVDAIEELSSLEAKAEADREAFKRSEEDLRRALADIQKPLPARPLTLDRVDSADEDSVRAQRALADAYRKAWEQRRTRYQGAVEIFAALQPLAATLRPTQQRLLDRIVALRPLLIEAQRKIDRRDLGIEQFGLPEGSRSIADWIAKSAELSTRKDEVLGEIDELTRRLEADRKEFESLPVEDPATTQFVRRIQIALSVVDEATVVGDEQRKRLAAARPETVPSELESVVVELKERRNALELATKRVGAGHETLRAIISQREALETPRREDIPEGEGLPELRAARRDSELAARMIGYYDRDLELLEAARAEQEKLLTTIEKASSAQALFTRQMARAMATVDHATELIRSGALPDWSLPPGATRQILWDEWRRLQLAEHERLELAETVRARLADAKAVEAIRAQLAKAEESRRYAEDRLKTELSYAEFVSQMASQADEQLLALLAPDGEIARNVTKIETDISHIGTQIASATEACHEAVRAIETVENPYSRAVLRDRGNDFIVVRERLEGLEEGELPPDESEKPRSALASVRVQFPDELHEASTKTVIELAGEERKYLGLEQQFGHLFLEYFLNLEASLTRLRDALAERRRLDTARETEMNAWIREEKRRYAAAREIRRRLAEDRFDKAKVPEETDRWLNREAIRAASSARTNMARTNSLFYARVAYEIDRLEKIITAMPVIRSRSEGADTRARLAEQPYALLVSALTPIEKLGEVSRKNLEYDARVLETEQDSWVQGVLERFTVAAERERFEEPLRTYYRELANTHRVTRSLETADDYYVQLINACVQERQDLQPSRKVFRETVAVRLFDYQAARYAAAVAVHSSRRARYEKTFREQFDRDLPYRLSFREGDKDLAAALLVDAAAQLAATRAIATDFELLLSKVGIQQEVGWYQSQIARIASLLNAQTSHEDELRQRIASLRESYRQWRNSNALRGFGITLAIPVFALVIVRLLRRFARRFEDRIVFKHGEAMTDKQRRLQTVSKTLTAAISVLVWTIALVYIFAQLGLDVTPIVASASVVGLAVAFGAQALIKDFFYGFFILVENQFTIGDVVTLGSVSGTVEKISLRITVLRDLQGVVHYIPNGSIGQVSNNTQGWSRAVMEISVAYKEDSDHVSQVLEDVLLDMAREELWRTDIIEEPVVAGVQNLTERSVDIRVMIKTRPGQQWKVAREARRRIKRRFDELGIQIPFPHRVVHLVYEGEEAGREAGGLGGGTSRRALPDDE